MQPTINLKSVISLNKCISDACCTAKIYCLRFIMWDLDKVRVSCLSDGNRFCLNPKSNPTFLFYDSGGLNV